jgi:hypothetical protein
MSAESLGRWIDGREPGRVSVMVIANDAEENQWEIAGAIYETLGGAETVVGVSTTCGFVDISNRLNDGRLIHIYIGDGT